MPVAVVTGGTGELGRGVALALARQGFEVHRTATRAVGPETGEPGLAAVHVVNLVDLNATRALAQHFDAVHALVLCAGGFAMAALDDLDEADVQQMLDVNFKTAIYALAAFTPRLAAGAAVVLVGSQAYQGAAGKAPYAAAKAAVVSLAKSAAAELGPRQIRVNAVLPDTIDTPANRRAMPAADSSLWATPAEIGAVIGWLCSDASRVVSGNAINVGR
jgi:NAD(P)-dependent dehydrogenase (short-subunit alcohol dehydrogenase family)